jgi:hypothetical protein
MKTTATHRKHYPPGLGRRGKLLWASIIDYATLDPCEEVLAERLCRAVNVLDRIDAELADMGVVVSGSERQPVVNKLLHEQREQVKLIDQLQRSLALPVGGESYGKRRSGEAKRVAKVGRPRKTHDRRVSHLVRQEGA